jgi:DNA repair protein RadC
MASKSSPSRPKDGTRRPTSELSDSGGEALPHYHGHRQRLRERFLEGGRDALPDYELLELLLFMAIPRVDIKPLAKALLGEFKTFGATISAPGERLKEFGLSESAITSLKVVEAAARRLAEGAVVGRPVLSSWEALVDYCAISIGHAQTEEFHVLFLDRKNVLIKDEPQSKGTVDHTPVYPREVLKRALELGASALILVHNHPSGDPTPSRGDILMTREIAAAAKALKIEVHDHLVIGRGKHASFKALGLL